MIDLLRYYTSRLPQWAEHWLAVLVPTLQILLVIGVAWLLNRLVRRLVQRLGEHYHLPPQWTMWLRDVLRWMVIGVASLVVLARLGVSASVLWTAFTGFAAVGAVAFFAAWSVLSNLFCALLIMATQPFRLGDDVELLDTAEKPGAKGRVLDINMLYTTLREQHEDGGSNLIQVPNMLFFQRVLRRWPGGQQTGAAASPKADTASPSPASGAPSTPLE